MATIETTAATTRHRKGFARHKGKSSPRIDMTPMIDPVLLLIAKYALVDPEEEELKFFE